LQAKLGERVTNRVPEGDPSAEHATGQTQFQPMWPGRQGSIYIDFSAVVQVKIISRYSNIRHTTPHYYEL